MLIPIIGDEVLDMKLTALCPLERQRANIPTSLHLQSGHSVVFWTCSRGRGGRNAVSDLLCEVSVCVLGHPVRCSERYTVYPPRSCFQLTTEYARVNETACIVCGTMKAYPTLPMAGYE